MKKTLPILCLVAVAIGFGAMVSPCYGAGHQSRSFLGVTTLEVTNAVAYENLTFAGGNTNDTAIIYTARGNSYKVGTTTNAAGTYVGTTQPLLSTAALWAGRNGEMPLGYVKASTTSWTNNVGDQYLNASIGLKMTCDSGAEDAVTFTFAPISGKDGDIVNDAAAITVVLTGVASSTVSTNIPILADGFAGSKGIAWLRVTNAETAASGAVTITEVSLNGFVP